MTKSDPTKKAGKKKKPSKKRAKDSEVIAAGKNIMKRFAKTFKALAKHEAKEKKK